MDARDILRPPSLAGSSVICVSCGQSDRLPAMSLEIFWANGLYWHRPCCGQGRREPGRWPPPGLMDLRRAPGDGGG